MTKRREKILTKKWRGNLLAITGDRFRDFFIAKATSDAEMATSHESSSDRLSDEVEDFSARQHHQSAICISLPSPNFAVVSPGIRFGEEFEHQKQIQKAKFIAQIAGREAFIILHH